MVSWFSLTTESQSKGVTQRNTLKLCTLIILVVIKLNTKSQSKGVTQRSIP
jgi:hypothetical protein